MSEVIIYHNPACGTSRNVLEVIRETGIEPKVVEYLKAPLSREELAGLLAMLRMPPRGLLRQKEGIYEALGLADPKWSDEQLIVFIADNPSLMNRPVVVTGKGARLCRPKEAVLEIL